MLNNSTPIAALPRPLPGFSVVQENTSASLGWTMAFPL